jgi:ubiquinone biosynthesis protein Coq4
MLAVMNLVVFDSTELVAVARALRAIAETNASFTDVEADFIAAIAAMHGVTVDPRALETITPEALAAAVTDAFKRKRAVQLLTVMSLVEGEATLESEKALRQFASALAVDERGLDVVREVAKEQILLARFDMVQRMRKTLFRDQTLATLKSLATAAIFGEDRATAEKYRALAKYPEGSLGRALYDSWREHGFAIPGEKNGLPERGIFHDIGHILSGYGVDPHGEIRQGAFQAGFVREDGFAFFLFVVLQFHIGVRITPVAKGEKGYFDVKDVLRAVERGAACKVDLSDPKDFDFWAVARVPVEELRARYGIPPLEA